MIPARDPLGRSVEPMFQLLLTLHRTGRSNPDAARLYEGCCREIEQHETLCRELDVPPNDAADARYALVALIDETALHCEGVLREYWLPRLLQTRFFQENQAGEGFFERLAALRLDGKRSALLRVFYLCLLLGFKGKYELRGSELELMEIHESVRRELQRAKAIPSEVLLSPQGRRPRERTADTSRNRLLLTLTAISTCVAALAYVGMRVSLEQQTQQLIGQISGLWGN
jgi:type VI secretion system protein ImpK